MVSKRITAQIQTATHLGTFDSSDPRWHELRANRIGGSEVGAIAGESRYESAYSLWAKKSGLIPSNLEESEPMYWGKALEPAIIDRFERDHPEFKIERNPGTWVSNAHDWMLANPDALFINSKGKIGVIECKTARYDSDWRTTDADGFVKPQVPRYYQTQVQWYLAVLGLDTAFVCVLFGGSDYQEFQINADPMWQAHDFAMADKFRQHVLNGTAPDWDGSEATLETVRALNPLIEKGSSVELGDAGMYLALALEKIATLEAEANELKSVCLDAMGTAEIGLVHDLPAFVRQQRGNKPPFLMRKK